MPASCVVRAVDVARADANFVTCFLFIGGELEDAKCLWVARLRNRTATS